MDGTNIIDYLKWRGDLSFGQTPFNDVDSLILSQIIYIPFEGIVPSIRSTRTITLRKAAEKFFDMYDETKSSLGALLPKEIFELFRLAGQSVRFGEIRLSRYVNKINHATEIQFCAMTIFIDELNEVFIDFRGTDDTIVGWKEDFNMGFMTPVPSQTESVRYFNYVISRYVKENPDLKIRLGGHSKGGNLAVFAATFVQNVSDIAIQDRIECIYNFDGPGFDDKVIQSKEYVLTRDKIKTIIPQSSVVGMLLGHEEGYTVVKSNQVGLLQHDALSWEVVGTEFICLESVTDSSLVLDKTLKTWIKSMDPVSAERFVTALFEILSATDAKTLTELMTGKNRSISVMMKAYAGEDEDTKKMLKSAVRSMIDIWKRNIRKKTV
ncbi:MAG: DUF2974 domain-containing protein [Alistipes sp.]|nr:DUF2974 domain-containing protein [Alistipes sp.]